MHDIKLSLIQSSLHWENTEANLKHFSSLIDQIKNKTDLIILPEMFNTGFTMNVNKCAEKEDGKSFNFLKKMARLKSCSIVGSVLTKDHEKYFNRLFLTNPDGTYEQYDKRHLFRMGNEHKTMTQGYKRKIVELKGWKVNLQICYDLRFPVWSKNNFINNSYEYDALLYIANWPEIRKHAYLPLLKARAIENQAYVIWVNRVGRDGNNVKFSGNTMVVDPYGKIQYEAKEHEQEIVNTNLSRDLLDDFRHKFKVGSDWDAFDINTSIGN